MLLALAQPAVMKVGGTGNCNGSTAGSSGAVSAFSFCRSTVISSSHGSTPQNTRHPTGVLMISNMAALLTGPWMFSGRVVVQCSCGEDELPHQGCTPEQRPAGATKRKAARPRDERRPS